MSERACQVEDKAVRASLRDDPPYRLRHRRARSARPRSPFHAGVLALPKTPDACPREFTGYRFVISDGDVKYVWRPDHTALPLRRDLLHLANLSIGAPSEIGSTAFYVEAMTPEEIRGSLGALIGVSLLADLYGPRMAAVGGSLNVRVRLASDGALRGVDWYEVFVRRVLADVEARAG